MIVIASVLLGSSPVGAQRDYGYEGGGNQVPNQFEWNDSFPVLCGLGSYQSPFNIDTRHQIRAKLPKLIFHYHVGHIVYLDHDDQLVIDHGAGNYITIGSQRYNLEQVHFHTPGEYTVNGGDPFPLEFHFVHVNADPNGSPQFAAVGVLVNEGNADRGILKPPSQADPTTVDMIPSDLLPPPARRNYWRFTGSLTTPGSSSGPTRCAEGLLWTVMKTPITMSPAQIDAFKASSISEWGTDVTNRPPQPANGRYILTPLDGF